MGVRFDLGQHRVGGPIEQLNRRDVSLEISVSDKSLEGISVAHSACGVRWSKFP